MPGHYIQAQRSSGIRSWSVLGKCAFEGEVGKEIIYFYTPPGTVYLPALMLERMT